MRTERSPADLLGDAGVLGDEPVLEFFGCSAVRTVGGLAVLPWRSEWRAALGDGVEAVSLPAKVAEQRFHQAVVHLQKGRAATESALAAAWKQLEIGDRLLLVGGNDLGIKSAIKRLADAVHQAPTVLANRARARVASFEKSHHHAPEAPVSSQLIVEYGQDSFVVDSAVGVFSGDGVDMGTQLVLDHLAAVDSPRRVLDMGCGIGILGLAALRHWGEASAVLADADRRAVEAAELNARTLELDDRCRVQWWDALSERPPVEHCDLIVLNPPFHTGKAVDLAPARSMFRAVDQVLEHGGLALVVANRTLPYERDLREIGRLSKVAERAGFKLLEVKRG